MNLHIPFVSMAFYPGPLGIAGRINVITFSARTLPCRAIYNKIITSLNTSSNRGIIGISRGRVIHPGNS
jgi:hypothetical protein